MYHLCTTAAFQTIYHKRKILDIRLNIKDFSSVGVTGFEPATTRPPDVYSKIKYSTNYQSITTIEIDTVDLSVDSIVNHG